MKRIAAIAALTALSILSIRSPAAITTSEIYFDDIKPQGMTNAECWTAVGRDDSGRVYIGFTGTRNSIDDFAMYRYDPATGNRKCYGSFRDISARFGNLQTNEPIPKGHTHFTQIGRKMYMGSQNFHDFKQDTAGLGTMRGAHLYAIDLDKDTVDDISRIFPGGVTAVHQGNVAICPMPGTNLLIGLLHPLSDMMIYNTVDRTVEIAKGIPWQLNNPLSREVVPLSNGKIYTVRGTEDPSMRARVDTMWAYDVNTHAFTQTNNLFMGGFLNGQCRTKDGKKIYLCTVNGELYVMDGVTGVSTHLCHFLPQADYASGTRIDYLYGITLSPDEKKIFGVISTQGRLYEYDIAGGTVVLLKDLGASVYTSSNTIDPQGNLYVAKFDVWSGNGRLLIINLSDRVGNVILPGNVAEKNPAELQLRVAEMTLRLPHDFAAKKLTLSIYDLKGRFIKSLVAGMETIDLRRECGICGGIYLVKVVVDRGI
jgi:Tfp pilus assembly protein PilZ